MRKLRLWESFCLWVFFFSPHWVAWEILVPWSLYSVPFIYFVNNTLYWGFLGSSVGKESACNAGGCGSIPGLTRSPGEGIGHPLQYSCLENAHGQRSLRATVHGVPKSQTWLSNSKCWNRYILGCLPSLILPFHWEHLYLHETAMFRIDDHAFLGP